MKEQEQEDRLLTIGEARARFPCSRHKFYEWIQERRFPVVQIGFMRFVKESDLNQFIEENTIGAKVEDE